MFPNLGIPTLCLLATLEGTRQREKSQSWSHPGLTVLTSIIPWEKAVQGHHHLKIQAGAQHSTLGCDYSPPSSPESRSHILSPLGNNPPAGSISNPKTCPSSSPELVGKDTSGSDPSFPSLERNIYKIRPREEHLCAQCRELSFGILMGTSRRLNSIPETEFSPVPVYSVSLPP